MKEMNMNKIRLFSVLFLPLIIQNTACDKPDSSIGIISPAVCLNLVGSDSGPNTKYERGISVPLIASETGNTIHLIADRINFESVYQYPYIKNFNLFYSDDDGKTWSSEKTPDSLEYLLNYFYSENIIILSGSGIIAVKYPNDPDASWRSFSGSFLNADLNGAVYYRNFLNEIIRYDPVFQENITLEWPKAGIFDRLLFTGPDHAWGIINEYTYNNEYIHRTRIYRLTPDADPVLLDEVYEKARFFRYNGPDQFYYLKNDSVIRFTENGGSAWQEKTGPVNSVAAGFGLSESGLLYWSGKTDGIWTATTETDWIRLHNTALYLNSSSDDSIIFAADGDILLRSSDSGKSWLPLVSVTQIDPYDYKNGLHLDYLECMLISNALFN